MKAISIENLFKTYPASFPRLKSFFRISSKPPVEALKNISIEIERGEIFGLIGRNGAGKTTLSKIIATLVQPTAGKILVNGFDSVKNDVQVRSLIGLATAEERSFYWRLTAEQNLLFFARLYGMKDKAAKSRIAELFETLSLSDLAKRSFSELSTGNKQKLAIARALMAKPPVLILDEPTRSLDPFAAVELREMISNFQDVTILLTSHNLSEIEVLCHRVAIISKGEIRALETPENLRLNHAQRQKVKVVLSGISEISLKNCLIEALSDFEIKINPDSVLVLCFNRVPDDFLLGKTISILNEQGAQILNIETEKPSLLDVLEKYE